MLRNENHAKQWQQRKKSKRRGEKRREELIAMQLGYISNPYETEGKRVSCSRVNRSRNVSVRRALMNHFYSCNRCLEIIQPIQWNTSFFLMNKQVHVDRNFFFCESIFLESQRKKSFEKSTRIRRNSNLTSKWIFILFLTFLPSLSPVWILTTFQLYIYKCVYILYNNAHIITIHICT